MTCLAYRYTYADRSQGYILIVAVHYGSYLRADKYLHKVVDWPFDMNAFSSNHFVQILYLFVHPLLFRLHAISTSKIKIILFCMKFYSTFSQKQLTWEVVLLAL